MDILIFAAIAGFVLYKLYTVLGQDVGYKAENKLFEEEPEMPVSRKAASRVVVSEGIETKLSNLQTIDPNFRTQEFIEGASQAFKLILEALNQGDRATLLNLVQKDLYKIFNQVITSREKDKETWNNELIRIQSTEIVDAYVKKSDMYVTVKFVSDQILATLDKNGKIVDGDTDQIEVITDVWTFTRDKNSTDPNWFLCNTASAENS